MAHQQLSWPTLGTKLKSNVLFVFNVIWNKTLHFCQYDVFIIPTMQVK